MKDSLNFLLITLEGGGNIPPIMGLAQRLAQRGHKVSVLTEPCLKEAVEAYGFAFIPFQQYFTRKNRVEDFFRDWNASLFNNPTFDIIFKSSAIVTEETYALLQKEKTDVLLADIMMPGSLIAAEALGVPRVVLFHMTEYILVPTVAPVAWGCFREKELLAEYAIGCWEAYFIG